MSSPNVRVEKIGGTSMTRFAECLDNIILRDTNDVYDRVMTVSAYGGVTNALLEHKKTGAPGIYKKFADHAEYESALQDLKKQLCDLNKDYVECGLDLEVADRFISERIDETVEVLKSMYQVLASGYVSRDALLLASREILASIGRRRHVVLLNNISSFTTSRERAEEFGDYIMRVAIPLPKVFFYTGLLPGMLKGEEEYAVIGGLYEIRLSAY